MRSGLTRWCIVVASMGLLAATTVSCASQGGPTGESDPSVAATEPSVAATPSESASATSQTSVAASESPAAKAAPEELRGEWRTQSGEDVVLTLEEARYVIQRGDGVGSGRIAVTGSQIEFSHSALCEGTGLYEWAIADGMLTLVPLEPRDPCGNRSQYSKTGCT
jgi:hypothetical protein